MTPSTTVDTDFVRLLADIFGDWRRGRKEPTASLSLDRALWATLSESDLTRLTATNGTGATWAEAAELLRAAARAAAPVPLAENDLLALWLLARSGLGDAGDAGGIRTVATLDPAGRARGVPWAGCADSVVALWQDEGRWFVADVPAAAVTVVSGHDLAGQPRDDVQVDLAALSGVPVAEPVRREYLLRGALARAVQSTGALEQAVGLSISHTSQRHQFGRPIAKFQAVQQLVADAACESALARAATDAAVAALMRGTDTLDELELRVAIARSVTGHATSVVVRNAHQVHGAIGTTLEHPLHEVTLPALAWRSEFGSLDHWDRRLTDLLIGAGGSAWQLGVPLR
ncbi:acyl-CoA dehydrogenase family protein [Actinomadura welshii]|uniref:acyl-CoA dehydrogenase family protein n=1 Tax=Actinomadura welshii TaxID=3103817 RepID=UPI00041C18D0|nr:acyl-CoA dehydrogenase family protein [Actinomadura madurae]